MAVFAAVDHHAGTALTAHFMGDQAFYVLEPPHASELLLVYAPPPAPHGTCWQQRRRRSRMMMMMVKMEKMEKKKKKKKKKKNKKNKEKENEEEEGRAEEEEKETRKNKARARAHKHADRGCKGGGRPEALKRQLGDWHCHATALRFMNERRAQHDRAPVSRQAI